jgi:Nucleoside 2-deoxyribosyltransferase
MTLPLYYIAHRLFAAHDRALGAYLAERLARTAGPGSVFLPFCDTDEQDLVSDCKGRLLFDLDCERLRRIAGMIAVLHGPSLDDGVCMEIGFASASGVPVVIVSTDFQTYSHDPAGPATSFPEPLLDHLATTVIRMHRLPSAARRAGHDRLGVFLRQNLAQVSTAAAQAASALHKATREPARGPGAPSLPGLAFIEPSPYFRDRAWEDVSRELAARGWRVHMAHRLQPGADPVQAARSDWAAAMTASLALVDARGPETPPGAALVTGALTARGMPVLAACPAAPQTLADGREPNWRNLMIQYAVTARYSCPAELATTVNLPCPAG